MVSTYARIDAGRVAEMFSPPGALADVPIGDLFHTGLLWADVTTAATQPEPGWSAAQDADGVWSFAPPPPPPPAPAQPAISLPDVEQQLSALMVQVQALMAGAK